MEKKGGLRGDLRNLSGCRNRNEKSTTERIHPSGPGASIVFEGELATLLT